MTIPEIPDTPDFDEAAAEAARVAAGEQIIPDAQAQVDAIAAEIAALEEQLAAKQAELVEAQARLGALGG